MSSHLNDQGRYHAVCDTCGRRTRKTFPEPVGLVALYELPAGWSIAPYPDAFGHANGTRGSQHECPGCAQRLGACPGSTWNPHAVDSTY